MVKIYVQNTQAKAYTDAPITSGSIGLVAQFQFSEEWDELNKIAVFETDNYKESVEISERGEVAVPDSVLVYPCTQLRVGVRGESEDGHVVIPTVYADCGTIKLGANTTPVGTPPTPSQAEQLQQQIEELRESGVDGAPGKSAYEYAVEGGFVGTEGDFAELLAGNSVKTFGAVGDGVTDDTAAFQAALAAERVVRVYGGTYVLSDTLVIRPNCCLELSQDTVLQYTQTSGNCIEMRSSATLRGNFAIIHVPYAFTGHVIDIVTTHDTAKDTEPYTHWTPMWKRGRYIYDVCIVKENPSGLHYSTDGVCSGTGIYMSGDGNNDVRFIWGALLQGIRIAGAFTRGIHAINFDLAGSEDSAWNHDMRIEAVIQGCETAVDLTNCNDVHLALAVQPQAAENGTPYAKWGVYLNDCRYIDMSSSVIWDWNATNSLYTPGGQYTTVAMFGNCCGLVYNDFGYYTISTPTRDRIYTDTPSNLKKMTIMQEPIDAVFKVIDGVPYFANGSIDEKIVSETELAQYFKTDTVKSFTDVLSTATGTDGAIYNGVGYKRGAYVSASGAEGTSSYYTATGFVPCTNGDEVYVKGMSMKEDNTGYARIVLYNSNKEYITVVNRANLITNASAFCGYRETDNGCVFTIGTGAAISGVAFVRITVNNSCVDDSPMVAINEEIKYKVDGFLADGINVKGDAVVLTSPSGKAYSLAVDNNGNVLANEIV